MNIAETILAYFASGTQHLSKSAGLEPQHTEKVLGTGLPLIISALSRQTATPEQQQRLSNLVGSLPSYGSIEEVLSIPDGQQKLNQTGEVIKATLLQGQSQGLFEQVSQLTGASLGGVQKLLTMALPLLLGLFGRHKVNLNDLGSILSPVGGSLGPVASTGTAAPPVSAGLGELLNPATLLDFLKQQFSGAAAEKVGIAAGFANNAAGRAVLGAMPLVLGALISKAKTPAGAEELLNSSRQFDRLSDTQGHLNMGLLGDGAEMSRLEGQGRGLLGSLFGNVEEIAGRLGTALGGSGANASRLLALIAPLLMSILGNRARAGQMTGSAFSGLLGGLDGKLAALLPAGLSGLTGLLSGQTAAVSAPVPPAVHTPAVPTPAVVQASGPVQEQERRAGIPWWLIALPLLAVLALLFSQCNKKTTTPPPVTSTTCPTAVIVENPSSGADLPAEAFAISGKAPANMALSIKDQGQEVAKATADASCNWTAQLPAPTPGEHTFTIDGGQGVRSEFKANIVKNDMANPGGEFKIIEPADQAQLSGGGFIMSGTGQPGDEFEVFEDRTSLGKVKVGTDGKWTKEIPSPEPGDHTYSARGAAGAELGSVIANVGKATGDASKCNKEYTLSISDQQTVSEPFRFGGVGKGKGYSVTVKRGDRTIGTKDVPLDGSCGWSYQSKPGAGTITYEVRPLGRPGDEPLSTVNLTVKQ